MQELSRWGRGEDLHREISLSEDEAASGVDKKIKYKRGREKKTLMVKVPPGVTEGTKIRLKGMGLEGTTPGDLLITVKVRD